MCREFLGGGRCHEATRLWNGFSVMHASLGLDYCNGAVL